MGIEVPSNGEEAKVIKIVWEPKTQSVKVDFNPQQFRTWEYILAMLEMAKNHANVQREMCMAAAMQQRAMQAQQDAHIRNQIKLN